MPWRKPTIYGSCARDISIRSQAKTIGIRFNSAKTRSRLRWVFSEARFPSLRSRAPVRVGQPLAAPMVPDWVVSLDSAAMAGMGLEARWAIRHLAGVEIPRWAIRTLVRVEIIPTEMTDPRIPARMGKPSVVQGSSGSPSRSISNRFCGIRSRTISTSGSLLSIRQWTCALANWAAPLAHLLRRRTAIPRDHRLGVAPPATTQTEQTATRAEQMGASDRQWQPAGSSQITFLCSGL